MHSLHSSAHRDSADNFSCFSGANFHNKEQFRLLFKQHIPNWFSVIAEEQQELQPVTSIICLLLLAKQVVLDEHKDIITVAFLARNDMITSCSASSHSTKAISETAYQQVITEERNKQWGRVFHRDHTSVLHISGKKPQTQIL